MALFQLNNPAIPPSKTIPQAGSFTSVDALAHLLTDNSRDGTPLSEVLFRADVANTGTIALGNEDGQFFKLAAGDVFQISITHIGAMTVKASASAQTLYWIGRS